ncbi:hypothetical protein ASPWEDRAFT_235042 [Aspergillus wentii DTO 134E9]|uniref:Uncharacterized protein n=1 Tax=Aspergillus wentii DTO 134E9 TaxID=1073089 RepID=A0A1L9S0X2_ASPWE|nr:uncharacterized protein ASPWEDRAFT_235042 [Aspergillus wentii DTO 134E9]OJJ40810.1 hypothetical protein ASPWEDRAFT_235042 [Aspergillus wentii DTO 134E9]
MHLCEKASIYPDWLGQFEAQHSLPVFQCGCTYRHDMELSDYSLSPMSLIVRLNGQPVAWKIWLFSRKSTLSSLIIENIPPSYLNELEYKINQLATNVAAQTVDRRAGSLMAFPSINPYTDLPGISVSNMICDTRQLYNQINHLNLIASEHSFSTGSIEVVKLVHYKQLDKDGNWLFYETADLILHLQPEGWISDDDHSQLTVTIDDVTKISGSNASVKIPETSCVSTTHSDQQDKAEAIDVEMEFYDGKSANYLLQQLQCL